MQAPQNYKTLRGLSNATRRVLELAKTSGTRVNGMSSAMWLHNAEWVAKTYFNDETAIQTLRRKYAITRPEDLKGGHSLFGFPLPRRNYIIGDVVQGVGQIDDVVDDQVHINGQWFHKRSLNCSGK